LRAEDAECGEEGGRYNSKRKCGEIYNVVEDERGGVERIGTEGGEGKAPDHAHRGCSSGPGELDGPNVAAVSEEVCKRGAMYHGCAIQDCEMTMR